jgi:pSer/pThr/pTyr-binding forkhead associated (FHA) protein
LPKNSGNEEVEGDYVLETKYYLNGKSIKGKPLYELTSEHIIGSEEGDIIIEDKNVSSKHLQVNLAEGVVTIMDLSSELGTKVIKKRSSLEKK